MNILFDIHTHTRHSDGKHTVAQNAASARKQGLATGISDHGPGHPWYGVRRAGLLRSGEEIAALPEYEQNGRKLPVLQGIEANLMDEEGSVDLEGLPPFDYHLMGYHKGIFPKSSLSLNMKLLHSRDPETARKRMTDAMIAALENPRIDAITHPGAYIPVDMARLAAAAAAKGVLLEINHRHPMTVEDAQDALAAGAYFLVSSDAHRSELVGNVDNALEIVARADIPEARIVNSSGYTWPGAVRLERLEKQLRGQ